jgi:predicted enzyme related to lactoylglutathione lyase
MGRETGGVVHFELHTDDQRAAASFYSRLLGWRTEPVESPVGMYLGLELHAPSPGSLTGSITGGIVECGTERALWLPYVGVDDVTRSTAAARALGATVTLEPREGPAGWRSVVSTPSAGEVALWQGKPAR